MIKYNLKCTSEVGGLRTYVSPQPGNRFRFRFVRACGRGEAVRGRERAVNSQRWSGNCEEILRLRSAPLRSAGCFFDFTRVLGDSVFMGASEARFLRGFRCCKCVVRLRWSLGLLRNVAFLEDFVLHDDFTNMRLCFSCCLSP